MFCSQDVLYRGGPFYSRAHRSIVIYCVWSKLTEPILFICIRSLVLLRLYCKNFNVLVFASVSPRFAAKQLGKITAFSLTLQIHFRVLTKFSAFDRTFSFFLPLQGSFLKSECKVRTFFFPLQIFSKLFLRKF